MCLQLRAPESTRLYTLLKLVGQIWFIHFLCSWKLPISYHFISSFTEVHLRFPSRSHQDLLFAFKTQRDKAQGCQSSCKCLSYSNIIEFYNSQLFCRLPFQVKKNRFVLTVKHALATKDVVMKQWVATLKYDFKFVHRLLSGNFLNQRTCTFLRSAFRSDFNWIFNVKHSVLAVVREVRLFVRRHGLTVVVTRKGFEILEERPVKLKKSHSVKMALALKSRSAANTLGQCDISEMLHYKKKASKKVK